MIWMEVGRGAYGDGVEFGVRMYARSRFPAWHLAKRPPVHRHGECLLHAHGAITRKTDPLRETDSPPQGCPVVNVGDEHDCRGLPTVIPDNRAIGRIAGEHLLLCDLQCFAFCGQVTWWNTALRLEGYADVVRAAGHTLAEFHAAENDDSFTELREWLLTLPRPVGIFADSDLRAFDIIDAALRLGLRVPEDLAVLGVGNDSTLCETCVVPISSVAVDAESIGYQAASLLDQLIQGDAPPANPLQVAPLCVVERDSTSGASVRDPMVARAVTILHKYHAEPLTAERLASMCRVSKRTLHRRFQSVLGHGPMEELRRIRIELAKRLLRDSKKKIIDIALTSGFAGAPQFSSTFHEATGISPTAFRNAHAAAVRHE